MTTVDTGRQTIDAQIWDRRPRKRTEHGVVAGFRQRHSWQESNHGDGKRPRTEQVGPAKRAGSACRQGFDDAIFHLDPHGQFFTELAKIAIELVQIQRMV